MTTRFTVNTNAGFYEIENDDLEVLKKIGSMDKLISLHYEFPLINMGGMRGGKPQLQTYGDKAPEGMKERVDKFTDIQSSLMSGFFYKLSGKICFAGTKIYLTHINEVNQLDAISKLIESDYDKAYDLYLETESLTNHYLTYPHICRDIMDQISN